MADEADEASKTEHRALQAALASQAAAAAANKLHPKGTCYYCDETVPAHALFCDADCRNDYDHEQRLLKRR